jgi:hypothetical protein
MNFATESSLPLNGKFKTAGTTGAY